MVNNYWHFFFSSSCLPAFLIESNPLIAVLMHGVDERQCMIDRRFGHDSVAEIEDVAESSFD